MLTRSQISANKVFLKWWNKKSKNKKEFMIGGAAGTGKSFWVNQIIEEIKIPRYKILVVAYTGQAVSVLRRIGVTAFTIYSKFMEVHMEKKKDDKGNIIYRGGIPYEVPVWKPVKKLDYDYDLIIVEEASFVNESLGKLIVSYGIPTLFIGDHEQLPPVTGTQYFTENKLDAVLEDTMRQLDGSDLLRYLTNVRRGNPIRPQDYKSDVYFLKSETMEDAFRRFRRLFASTEMIICGTNKQRSAITNLYRKKILNADNVFPVKGERMICRRNRWNYKIQDYPLVNGTIGYNLNHIPMYDVDRSKDIFYMDFQPKYIQNDYFDRLACQLSFLEAPFGDKDIRPYMIHNFMESAVAITAHLSQGDQYKNVLYIPSWNGNYDYKRRLDYTAASRAERELFLMLL